MEYTTIQGTGLRVSKFCLGTMMFGGQTSNEESVEIVRYALENGINFFDTANIYTQGKSEMLLGEALKGHREEAVIATKVGGPSWKGENGKGLGRKHVMASVEVSLKRLRTDYIDIFYMHFPDPNTPMEETIETMDELIRAGKIRYYGVSNYAAWQICSMIEKAQKMQRHAPVITESVYNALTRGADEELLPFLRQYNIGMAAYNPLAGGLLTGKHTREKAVPGTRFDTEQGYRNRYWKDENFDAIETLEQIADENGMSILELAIRWILSEPAVTSPIIGVSRLEQLKQNIEIVEKGALQLQVKDACDGVWNRIKGDYFSYHR
ncbi:MAG: aldo/keto reductase [Lachnospiraceae bacterium]|nr:aldo/keto reductase [Lachnospiraceae bacterium]